MRRRIRVLMYEGTESFVDQQEHRDAVRADHPYVCPAGRIVQLLNVSAPVSSREEPAGRDLTIAAHLTSFAAKLLTDWGL